MTTRRGFLKMLGLGGAAAVAAPVVAKAVESEPAVLDYSHLAGSQERISKALAKGEWHGGYDPQPAKVETGWVEPPPSLFQFNVEGPIRKGDFVTLADGGYTVRAGGFDENEHLLGIVTELCEDGTAWVQLATDD